MTFNCWSHTLSGHAILSSYPATTSLPRFRKRHTENKQDINNSKYLHTQLAWPTWHPIVLVPLKPDSCLCCLICLSFPFHSILFPEICFLFTIQLTIRSYVTDWPNIHVVLLNEWRVLFLLYCTPTTDRRYKEGWYCYRFRLDRLVRFFDRCFSVSLSLSPFWIFWKPQITSQMSSNR